MSTGTKRTIPDPNDRQYKSALCIDCNSEFLAYQCGPATPKRCISCQQAHNRAVQRAYDHKRRGKQEKHGERPRANTDLVPAKWRLIQAPDIELWGHDPMFSLEEISAAIGEDGRAKYQPMREYPFAPGCVFQHVYTGARRVVNVKDGYIRLVREA